MISRTKNVTMKKIKLSDIGSLVGTNEQVEQKASQLFNGVNWLRIGAFKRDKWGSVLLSISNTSMTLTGRSLLINVINATYPVITTLSTLSSQIFTKGRIVTNGGIAYLEIYHSNAATTQAQIIASSAIEFNLYQTSQLGSVPEGASQVEFTF